MLILKYNKSIKKEKIPWGERYLFCYILFEFCPMDLIVKGECIDQEKLG
jgi:hypothetical protein